MSTSDHNVTETALDAAKCKLSAVTQGYFQDDFVSHFVPKPTRRTPLIHRGYYLRHLAIEDLVARFLATYETSRSVQIVSLGAGFDTLYFRLVQRRTPKLNFIEVDCDAISGEKKQTIKKDETSLIDAELHPKSNYQPNLARVLLTSAVDALDTRYALISCDLGDIEGLKNALDSVHVDRATPTLVIAECVLSYLEPSKGTNLLQWLSSYFIDNTTVIYDPISLEDAFGETLQTYFGIKGCELRSNRNFQTPMDQIDRFLRFASWKSFRLIDMNAVYDACTTPDEKKRIQAIEVFDEYTDWSMCNAHYAITIAIKHPDSTSAATSHWSDFFCKSRGITAENLCGLNLDESLVIRTFQPQDLKQVQALFQASHLEYACKAVKKFVFNRVRTGDLSNVAYSFLSHPRSHFWVVETSARQVIACIGVKPTCETTKVAELCRLSVHKDWRRRGLASLLLATLESYALSVGYSAVVLETIESMSTAQAFYASRGYSEAPARKKYSTFTLVSFFKSLE